MSFDLQSMEAIKQLKYRYVRALDSADMDAMRNCLTENVYVRFQGGVYTVEYNDRQTLLEFLSASFHSQAATSHQVHHPVIQFENETTAAGQWSLHDTYHDLNHRVIVSGAAEYQDQYVKEADGTWRIARSEYTRLYEMTQPMPENMVCTYHKLAETGKALNPTP